MRESWPKLILLKKYLPNKKEIYNDVLEEDKKPLKRFLFLFFPHFACKLYKENEGRNFGPEPDDDDKREWGGGPYVLLELGYFSCFLNQKTSQGFRGKTVLSTLPRTSVLYNAWDSVFPRSISNVFCSTVVRLNPNINTNIL